MTDGFYSVYASRHTEINKVARRFNSVTFVVGEHAGMQEVAYNSYLDFGLVPEGLPVIDPPEFKSNYAEVPGGSGIIDLSTAVSGFPVYKQREGSITFLPYRQSLGKTYGLRSRIANILHGRTCKVIIDRDPLWYYQGRITVKSWTHSNDGHGTKYEIGYNLNPYKYLYRSSEQEPFWDPIFFPGDYLDNRSLNAAEVNGDKSIIFHGSAMPVMPTFDVDLTSGESVVIKLYPVSEGLSEHESFTAYSGENSFPELMIYDDQMYRCDISGNAKVTIRFRRGSL